MIPTFKLKQNLWLPNDSLCILYGGFNVNMLIWSVWIASYVASLVLFPPDFLWARIFAFSVGGIGRHAQFFSWSRCHLMRFSSVGLGGIGCLLRHLEFIWLIPFACYLLDGLPIILDAALITFKLPKTKGRLTSVYSALSLSAPSATWRSAPQVQYENEINKKQNF